jgi:cytochrome P450
MSVLPEETMDWSVEYATASIALALLVILLFKMKWRDDLRPPVAATVVGHIINFKRTHDFHFDLHRRYKTYRVAYPTFSYVFTTDPANVEHILRFNFANYTKVSFCYIEEIASDILSHIFIYVVVTYVVLKNSQGKFIHDIMEDLLGDGILSVDGEQWRQQRKLASFEFSTKVLKDFSSVVFREIVVKLSKILLEAYGTKQTVEMQAC